MLFTLKLEIGTVKISSPHHWEHQGLQSCHRLSAGICPDILCIITSVVGRTASALVHVYKAVPAKAAAHSVSVDTQKPPRFQAVEIHSHSNMHEHQTSGMSIYNTLCFLTN